MASTHYFAKYTWDILVHFNKRFRCLSEFGEIGMRRNSKFFDISKLFFSQPLAGKRQKLEVSFYKLPDFNKIIRTYSRS